MKECSLRNENKTMPELSDKSRRLSEKILAACADDHIPPPRLAAYCGTSAASAAGKVQAVAMQRDSQTLKIWQRGVCAVRNRN